MSSNPDVVLLHWAFWVQGDLILIYYWGGLCWVVPTGGGPCSAVLRHLRAVNTLVHVQLNDWAGKTVTHPKRLNLGIHAFGTDLEGGNLVQQTKQDISDILYYIV